MLDIKTTIQLIFCRCTWKLVLSVTIKSLRNTVWLPKPAQEDLLKLKLHLEALLSFLYTEVFAEKCAKTISGAYRLYAPEIVFSKVPKLFLSSFPKFMCCMIQHINLHEMYFCKTELCCHLVIKQGTVKYGGSDEHRGTVIPELCLPAGGVGSLWF